MNLNHRVLDNGNSTPLDLVMHKIAYPMTILIPLAVFILSIFSVWQYLGQIWQVGSFSTSFIPFLSRLLGSLISMEPKRLQSILVLLGYIFGPISFYLLVYMITGRHLPALITGLATILPIFPFSATPPERLSLALVDRDGAHILGLTLIPLVTLVYLRYLKNGDRTSLILYELSGAFLSLISIFSVFILSIFLLFMSISEALIGGGRVKLWRFLISSLVLLALIALIYNIFLLGILMSNEGRATLAVLFNLLPMSFFLLPILGTFAFLIFDRKPMLQPVFLALSLVIMFGLLHLVETSFVDLPIFNQKRYAAELSFALPFLVSIIITWIFDALRAGKLIKRYPVLFTYRGPLAFGLAAVVLVILVTSIVFIPRGLV